MDEIYQAHFVNIFTTGRHNLLCFGCISNRMNLRYWLRDLRKRIDIYSLWIGPDKLEPEFFREIIGTFPNTPSVRNVNNFAHKAARRKKLSKYDYGLLGNLKKYDTRVPPNYNLMQVIKEVD